MNKKLTTDVIIKGIEKSHLAQMLRGQIRNKTSLIYAT